MIDLYVLDEDYRRSVPIDSYQSLIWTERFAEVGEFELISSHSDGVVNSLRRGTLLGHSRSRRVMVVESISEGRDESGVSTMTFTGRSIEAIMEDRVAYSTSTSSHKARVNDLVMRSLILGDHNAEDKVEGLKRGTNVVYLPSTIPPSTVRTTSESAGWGELLEAHENANSQAPLGFRIVQGRNDDGTVDLYYDNYTGNDRSIQTEFPMPHRTWGFENPYFLETDGDVIVWKNIAKNPGFTSLQMSLVGEEREFTSGNRASMSTVDLPYSTSGSGLQIKPASDSGVATAAYLFPYRNSTNSVFEGSNWKGRQLTVSATIEIVKKQTGTLSADARTISARFYDANANLIGSAKSNAAPNSVGITDLSVSFTIPSNAALWDLRLMNGSSNEDETVIWSDLTVMPLLSNPVGYFDGDYSPDSDLTPQWTPSGTSALVGRRIQGQDHVETKGCVLVQSTRWSVYHGISARMIRNQSGHASNQASLIIPSGGSGAEVTVWQETTHIQSQIGPDFGKLKMGSAMSTSKPNIANTSSIQMVSGGSTPLDANRIVLMGDFQTIGQSLWWDVLISKREDGSDPVKEVGKPLIFSERNDDFIASETFRSMRDYKNVAYVTHGQTLVEVDNSFNEGLGRKVIHVDASELELTGKALRREMELMGFEALRSHPETFLIDGTVTQFNRYIYDEDYTLGDIVLVGNHRGDHFPMRITEYIFVMDQEGFRSYPTFAEEPSVAAGVWISPEYDIMWSSADPIGTWHDQP